MTLPHFPLPEDHFSGGQNINDGFGSYMLAAALNDLEAASSAIGAGDVEGPLSATLNAVPRFSDGTGKIVKNSVVTIDDTGNIATAGTVDGRDVSVDGAALDARLPSTDQKAALAGTTGTPSSTNKYVTDTDTRNADARAPTAHKTSHVSGADQLDDAVAGGAHGLLLGADKTKLDNLTTANIPSAGEKAALAGTYGTPGASNKYLTETDPRLTGTGRPELDRLDVAGLGGAPIAAAGGDIILVGRELLQGQTFDGLQITETPAFVQLYALKPGDSGITVEMTVGAGGVTVITFNPGTGVLGIELPAAGATDDLVATAINADLSACNGYVRAVSGSAGSFTAAQGPFPFILGTGAYAKNKVMVAGLEALPANETGISATAKWSGSGIVCTTQAVGLATDVAAVAVQSNGLWTQQICGVMV